MTDRSIALSQIALSVLFFGGYFTVVVLFLLGLSNVPAELRDIFSGLIGLLSAGGLMILQFWFSRSRQADQPIDPQLKNLLEKLLAAKATQETIANA